MITLTREEAQQVLDIMESTHFAVADNVKHSVVMEHVAAIELLRARLAVDVSGNKRADVDETLNNVEKIAEPEKEQKMSDYDRGYLHGFDDAMEKPYEQREQKPVDDWEAVAADKANEALRLREQEQIALPIPFRAQGQQIASDGDDKAFCDLYSKEQMLAYGKASELAIDKTMAKRIATQLGWKPPLDVEQEPVAFGIIAFNTKKICEVVLDANEVSEIHPSYVVPLYTAPPQREWQGLPQGSFAGMTLQQVSAMKYAELVLKARNT